MIEDQTNTRFEGTTLVVETGGSAEEFDADFLVAVLLVSLAGSDGQISPVEIEKMMQLVGDHFDLKTTESLKILTGAVDDLATNPDLTVMLKKLASILTPSEKEDIAVMMFEVVAADSKEAAEEMGALAAAAEIIGISPDLLKKARQRFFAER